MCMNLKCVYSKRCNLILRLVSANSIIVSAGRSAHIQFCYVRNSCRSLDSPEMFIIVLNSFSGWWGFVAFCLKFPTWGIFGCMTGAHLWEELRPVNSVWNETHACVCKHLQFWPWRHQNGDRRIWDLHRIRPWLCNLGPSHFWIQCIKTQKGLVPNMQVYDLKFHQILIFKSDFVLISLNWKVKLRSFSARHHHCTWNDTVMQQLEATSL